MLINRGYWDCHVSLSLSRRAQSSPGQNSARASAVNESDTETEIADIHFPFLNERIPAIVAVTVYPANLVFLVSNVNTSMQDTGGLTDVSRTTIPVLQFPLLLVLPDMWTTAQLKSLLVLEDLTPHL